MGIKYKLNIYTFAESAHDQNDAIWASHTSIANVYWMMFTILTN